MRTHGRLRPVFLLLTALVVLASMPTAASAQFRGGFRRGPGIRVIVGSPFLYPPIFFDGGYYQYPYGPYPPYGPNRGLVLRDALSSEIRLEVKPRQAEVYVDGYRAGIVDDFDGVFQRLHLRPGAHEIVLYLNGYRTVKQELTLEPNSDQKIQYTMLPLAPGEHMDARPQPAPRPLPPSARMAPMPPNRPGQVTDRPDLDSPPPPPPVPPDRQIPLPSGSNGAPPPMPQGSSSSPRSNFGTLSIRTQPADAEILVDGERWLTPSGQDRLIVQLSEGKHRVQIRKAGYETFTTEIDVHRGETNPLNVSLLRSGGGF